MPRECLSLIPVFSFSFFVVAVVVVVRVRDVEVEVELRYDDVRDAALFWELEEQKE